jgi:hypothetical protein
MQWHVFQDESTQICPRMVANRKFPSSRNHTMHTLRTSLAHAQFYPCVRHRKAATHNWRILAYKGNIKGLKSIRVPKLTREPLYKPQHCQNPSNRNINMPSKRHLAVHYYSQVIDRINTIKDDTTQTCTKIQ